MVKSPNTSPAIYADLTWKPLYLAGAIAALLYLILGIIAPALLYIQSDFDPDSNGLQTLHYIHEHRAWWILEQTLVLAPSIFAIVTFMALFEALKQISKTYAAIGVMGAIVCQILFLAYFPIVMGLVDLSDQYTLATNDNTRMALVAAAESLVAQNRAIGPSEAIFSLAVLILSLLMRKGVFPRSVAYLGIATFIAYIVGMALRPAIGVAYLFWWAFFLVWFMAVAYRLFQLSHQSAAPLENHGAKK